MTSDISLWSERQRLRFIERVLFWRGYINRRDLMAFFGISAPQATNDLVNYSTRNPGGCLYNVRRKRYEAGSGMEPVLIEPEFGADMEALGSAAFPDGVADFVVRAEVPLRRMDVGLMRTLVLAAHEGRSLEVRYWSVASGTSVWRRISPRTFASDGLRWHVRAFCHRREAFRDFVIGRMGKVRGAEADVFADREDADWDRHVVLVLRANPEAEKAARRAIEMDYGMRKGELRWTVRRALLAYAARRLGFIEDDEGERLPILNEKKQLEWVALEEVGR